MKHIKKLLVIMAIATLIISMAIATASATSQVKNEKKDTEIIKIESKEKTTKYKITWNGNGGKIGTKKTVTTTVKKGSKIGKLVTPKRSSYTFKGWYTKKAGGTKITKSTKLKKSATLFARWTKKSNSNRVLSNSEKALVGYWFTGSSGGINVYSGGTFQYSTGTGIQYSFNKDGTYFSVAISDTYSGRSVANNKGFWRESGGTIYLTNKQWQYSSDGGKTFKPWAPMSQPNESIKIRHGSNEKGQYIEEVDSGLKYYKK